MCPIQFANDGKLNEVGTVQVPFWRMAVKMECLKLSSVEIVFCRLNLIPQAMLGAVGVAGGTLVENHCCRGCFVDQVKVIKPGSWDLCKAWGIQRKWPSKWEGVSCAGSENGAAYAYETTECALTVAAVVIFDGLLNFVVAKHKKKE